MYIHLPFTVKGDTKKIVTSFNDRNIIQFAFLCF